MQEMRDACMRYAKGGWMVFAELRILLAKPKLISSEIVRLKGDES
jgi:hypothetical protein